MHGRDPSKRVFRRYAFLRRITKGFARRIYLSARSESTNVAQRSFLTSLPKRRDETLVRCALGVANKWRGVRMDVFAARKVEELRNELLPQGTSEESAA